MSAGRSLAWLCACALAGCAAGAPEAAPPAPTAPPAPEGALSPERQRFERWKESATAADPRPDFARQAEAEAERRRSDALATGLPYAPGRERGIEQEMAEDERLEHAYLLDRLAALGAWVGSGCFPEEPDWSSQDDLIRHRSLVRDDFRERKPEQLKPVVDLGGDFKVGAYVAITLSCVIRVELAQVALDRYEARLGEVRYFALLSRDQSWWDPDATLSAEWILRHEQLHFDIAELVAHELGLETERLRHTLRGAGPDRGSAIEEFQRRWAERMEQAQKSFEELETRYDRETRHGNDVARQTEWFARVKGGLGAVRTGGAAAGLIP